MSNGYKLLTVFEISKKALFTYVWQSSKYASDISEKRQNRKIKQKKPEHYGTRFYDVIIRNSVF